MRQRHPIGRCARRALPRAGRALALLLGLGAVLAGFPVSAVTPQAEAAFPGRNGRIAFAVSNDAAPLVDDSLQRLLLYDADIFTVSAAGADIQQLSRGPETDLWPAWSPDGRRLVFMRAPTIHTDSDLYLIDASGDNLQQLTATPDLSEWGAAWSPDGSQIVFARGREIFGFQGEYHLYVMDADGSNVRQLTHEAESTALEVVGETRPAWSPDGRWIAYVDSDGGLTLISPDGLRRRTLRGCGGWPGAPSWAPDGRRLAFASSASEANDDSSDVWTIDRDGTDCVNLTQTPSGGVDGAPTWSPDGNWIAFLSDRDESFAIYKMKPDGSRVTKVIAIDLATAGLRPDWGRRP